MVHFMPSKDTSSHQNFALQFLVLLDLDIVLPTVEVLISLIKDALELFLREVLLNCKHSIIKKMIDMKKFF